MFWVRDTRDERRLRIEKLLIKDDAAIAVLLSAANLEWTMRRALLLLGNSPRQTIRKNLLNCHGLKAYKKIWADNVSQGTPPLEKIVKNWGDLIGARGKFQLRHELIHGSVGSCGVKFAKIHVDALMDAANDIDAYCQKRNLDIYSRLASSKR
jgi:hypothetical protein